MADESTSSAGGTAIVATAGTEYRLKRYTFVALLMIFGCWFLYDGFFNWPAQAAQFERLSPEEQAKATKPHSEFDIRLQRNLAIGLLILAPGLLIYFFYSSRGACRLSDGVLYVPGHPAIPLENIRALDMSRWERHGIAKVEYEQPPGSKPATLTLDEFVYQYHPIRAIVAAIEAHLSPETPMQNPEPPMQNS